MRDDRLNFGFEFDKKSASFQLGSYIENLFVQDGCCFLALDELVPKSPQNVSPCNQSVASQTIQKYSPHSQRPSFKILHNCIL